MTLWNKSKTKDLTRLLQQVAELRVVYEHTGLDEGTAREVDNLATALAEEAALIAADARVQMGDRSASTLVRSVRRALGFTVRKRG